MFHVLRRALRRLKVPIRGFHDERPRHAQNCGTGWTTAIAALAMSFSASTASAQPWTLTMSGRIDGGLLVSGASLEYLNNKRYTLALTVDPTLYPQYLVEEGVSFATGNNNPVSVLFTLEGASSTYLLTTSSGGGSSSLLTSFGDFLRREEALQTALGRTTDGIAIEASNSFASRMFTGLTADFAQHYSNAASGLDLTSKVNLKIADPNNAYALEMEDFDPETITINGGPTAVVPEPATVVLMAIGLGFIGVVVRRRA